MPMNERRKQANAIKGFISLPIKKAPTPHIPTDRLKRTHILPRGVLLNLRVRKARGKLVKQTNNPEIENNVKCII